MATKQNTSVEIGEIISADQVVKSRRGRVAVLNDDLTAFLASIPKGGAAVLKMWGPVEDKTERGKIAGVIRKHWATLDRGKPVINWNPTTNLPQVGEKVG